MQKSRRKSKRQQAWEYMRRNRNFRVGDILLILDISEQMLGLMLRQLMQAGYLKKIKSERTFRDKQFKLLKNTGVICPVFMQGRKQLYDKNTDEFLPRMM